MGKYGHLRLVTNHRREPNPLRGLVWFAAIVVAAGAFLLWWVG